MTGHVVTCMHDIERELKYTTNIVHLISKKSCHLTESIYSVLKTSAMFLIN